MQKAGKTLGEQPYFEDFSGFTVDTKAIVVSYSQQGRRYVFLPPDNVSLTAWTDWLTATYVSDDEDVEFRILYAKDSSTTPVPVSSPRVRMTLMPFVTFLRRVSERREGVFSETVPQC